MISLLFFPLNVIASAPVQARIGNKFFDTLEEAIKASTSKDTINLTSNVSLNDTLEINKTVNINLNNYDIVSDEKVFLVQGGSLNLSGNGTIRETKPNYGAIMIIGSTDSTKEDFSTVSIGSGITLEGWSGIFINHQNKTGYGILVNMNGKINAVDDRNGDAGAGIYVNGNILNEINSPIINLSDTVNITSTGTGIYAAGYATYNINGAYIQGEESGLGIKSGYFNILNGTIIGSGKDKTPTSSNNNGINPSGVAIQIESNPGYTGNVELKIKNGTIQSKNSNVIYEYSLNDGPTQVKDIIISGGLFKSDTGKPVFLLSDNFKVNYPEFISGGKFSSDPTAYLESGYSVANDGNSLYEVVSNTMSVFNSVNENNNKILKLIVAFSCTIVLGTIIYLKRNQIINLINKPF